MKLWDMWGGGIDCEVRIFDFFKVGVGSICLPKLIFVCNLFDYTNENFSKIYIFIFDKL